MTAKPAVIATLSALSFVPAALVARTAEAPSVAFRALDGVEPGVEELLHRAQAASPPIELAPVRINAVSARPSPRETQGAPACGAWRALRAGPRSASAGPAAVRACSGPPPSEARASMPTETKPARETLSSAPSGARLEYVVDLRTQ